jgi:hypothetical protein
MMKTKLLSLLLILAVSLTYSTTVLAQSNWTAVQQINTNEKLVVKKKDGKEVKGEMIEANDSTLTIDQKGKPLSIPRTEIQQVSVVKGKAQKGKWALIGAGVGAGTGAAIGTAYKHSHNSDDSEIYVGIGLLLGTGIGAASGLLFGQTRRERTVVYSAY